MSSNISKVFNLVAEQHEMIQAANGMEGEGIPAGFKPNNHPDAQWKKPMKTNHEAMTARTSGSLKLSFCLMTIAFFVWGSAARAQTLSSADFSKSILGLLQDAPLVASQPDGVIYMNWEAAGLVDVKATALVSSTPYSAPGWKGDAIRPYWRIKPAQAGRYRVVITRACPPGRESSATIHFRPLTHEGRGTGAKVGSAIPPTESWTAYGPFIMGEIELKAEEYLVEYLPYDWSSGYLINLQDVRLIPIGTLAGHERLAQPILKRLGVFEAPEVQALRARMEQLRVERTAAEAVVRRSTFSDFTTYDQMLAYDRELPGARSALKRLDAELKETALRERELLQEIVRQQADHAELTPEEATQVKDYLAANATVQDGATRDYPKLRFAPDSAAPESVAGAAVPRAHQPLFPPGNLSDLKIQGLNEHLPQIELVLPSPPDLAARRARFQARNSGQELADLCRRFAAVLVPGAPGLEEFERLAAAGRHREALEAYRTYFFAKLGEPEKYGAHTQNILLRWPAVSKMAQCVIQRPSPFLLKNALEGEAVVEFSNQLLLGKVGEPGEVLWAPLDLKLPEGARGIRGKQSDDGSAFWKTEEGQDVKRRILFYRGLKPICLGGDWVWTNKDFSSSLFYSYVVSGNKEHLARFCAYLDDYTMHAVADMDNSPLNIRAAIDHEPHAVLSPLLFGLRVVLDERPEFARDLDAATLVRLLMYAVEEYSPYNLRLRRSQMSNWGIMGLAGQMKVSAFLPEFKAMNYFVREAWRLANYNFISYRELDGPAIESWDVGHSTQAVGFDSGLPHARLPQDTGDFMQQNYFWDRMRVMERNLLTHVSPQGCYWPDWRSRDFVNSMVRFTGPMSSNTGRVELQHVKDEPEAQRRINAIMGQAPAGTEAPSRVSDYAPYAGMSYLRDGWRADSEYLVMQNVRARSQHLIDAPRTGYNLSKAGLCLVEGMPLAVDRKPQNHFYDSTPVGGKTVYAATSQRNVQPSRFHSSARFDLTEGLQDSPYARFWDNRAQYRGVPDPFSLYVGRERDESPIRDVKALRQVLHVRGEGLWLVHDRVLAPANATHEYMQCFKLPVRLHPEGFAERVALLKAAKVNLIEEDASKRMFRTANPGVDNVAVRLFSREPLQFANRLNRLDAKAAPEQLPAPLEEIGKALADGKTYAKFMKTSDMVYGQSKASLPVRPVLAYWTGTGNQSLVTAMYVLPAVDKLEEVNSNDARAVEQTEGPGGVVGCRIVTQSGAEVWMQGGPEALNQLACGPVTASAETLMVLSKEGKISGMVLGCQKMAVSGKSVKLAGQDFEFELDDKGQLAAVQPIHKPIDTVRIQPDQTVFTDTLEVTADIPGQDMSDVELRYMLQPATAFKGKDFDVTQGDEPTLESPLYSGPITVTESSMLKVRAFRKGLKSTPWHGANTDAGQTVAAIFRKQALLPAVKTAALVPGLDYTYAEGHWPTLFAYAGDAKAFAATAQIKGNGTVEKLLDPGDLEKVRATDRPYAVRYSGFIKVPTTGVYNFFAPLHLYTPTMDAGYDLRVFIDGKEWWPNPMLHAENQWSVALEAGTHRLEVAYVDYRWKQFRDEYHINWMPEQMWQGTPVLEVSGSGLPKQPVPSSWLWRQRSQALE